MDEVKELTTIDQVKAFSDPFRYRILMKKIRHILKKFYCNKN